jgi:segregation and condensation protein B
MDYMDRITSLEIVQVGDDKFAMQIKPEFTDKVKKFTTGGLIPEAVMRTLTVIALKQPIMKSLLIKLRGSGAYEHVKFLLDRGLVRSEKKGRSDEVTTTDGFADMFGLSRDVNKLKLQLKTQLGVKEEDEEEDATPPPPPEVPDL